MSALAPKLMKFYYLPLIARGEATKLMLFYGNVQYEDVIVPFDNWAKEFKYQSVPRRIARPSDKYDAGIAEQNRTVHCIMCAFVV